MKTILFIMLALLIVPVAAQSQTLSSSFSFSREPNRAGSIDYVLKPIVDEIHKKIGGPDRAYQALGALARPKNLAAVLLFANAQRESQLSTQSDKSVFIKAGSLEFNYPEYVLAAKSESESPIRLEIANVLISLQDFLKIATANSVSVKFGAVTYQLDKDNLEALRHMATEIETDQKKTN
jgi:hypothetical protein